MLQEVPLNRQALGTTTYEKVIDTQFREFVIEEPAAVPEPTVDEFFQLYEDLFFEIPITGEINSHEYLVKRSSEYIGNEFLSDNEKALLEEINSLRQQLLESNQILADVSKLT